MLPESPEAFEGPSALVRIVSAKSSAIFMPLQVRQPFQASENKNGAVMSWHHDAVGLRWFHRR
jgi:hypothetical protein